MSLPRKKRLHYLTPYRRHHESCTEKKSDVRCDCPIWCQGKVNGEYIREALNTRSMATAELKINDRLNPPQDGGPDGGGKLRVIPSGAKVTIAEATQQFLAAKKKDDRTGRTLDQYGKFLLHFRRYAESHGVEDLRTVTTPLIERYFIEYSSQWRSWRTRATKLDYLRVFFNYTVDQDWLMKSPAAKKSLNVKKRGGTNRKPWTHEQVKQILEAVDRLPEADRDYARAIILLLLFSGMRISDATFIQRESLDADRMLEYHVIKTRKPLGLPLELAESAVEALAKLPASRVYFFLPDRADDYRQARDVLEAGGDFPEAFGKQAYDAAVRKGAELVEKVLNLAGVKSRARCHTFRDTFAVNMLMGTKDVYVVSKFLGHSDVKITEHYLKLVKDYKAQMARKTRVLHYSLAS